jgi:hypothetical protein
VRPGQPAWPDSYTSRDGVATVAAALADRLPEVWNEVGHLIEREIPALHDDQRIVDMLEASVAENVSTVVHALRYGSTRRLAQRDVDAAALVRAYRLGQARFIRLFIEELHRQTGTDQIDGATTLRAIDQVSQYVDRVVGLLLPVYVRERTG